MIGTQEIIWGVAIFGVVALFGRKAVLKLVKDFFGIKKDIEKIKKEEAVE